MTVLNRIIPGKVVNRGINDKSIPDYTVSQATSPLHLPVISIITPKGPLADDVGTVWLNAADFRATFGNVFDHTSPYYNPTALLIQQLIAGSQSSIGVRRLSANKKVARTALSAFVQKVTVQDYERDMAGQFKRDAQGKKIPTGDTFEGLSIVIKPDPTAATAEVGGLQRRTITGTPANGEIPAVPDTEVFPLMEAIAGVGEEYNRSGLAMGVRNDQVNFRGVSDFVKATGVYPFSLKMFTESATGARTWAKTSDRRETVDFTLFKTTQNRIQYGIKNGFGSFTGTNVNRKVIPTPAPYNSVHIYEEHLTSLTQAMYAVESKENTTLVQVGSFPHQQMNPFTCQNHTGAPYYAITTGDSVVWDLSGTVKAEYGVSPFLNDAGELPEYVTPVELDDPFGVLGDIKFPITPAQAWEATNALVASDMATYLAGNETKNYTRNRQSFWWDVGYSQEVKDIAIQLLASRKDIMVIPCATVWEPGKGNKLNEVYSRFTALSNALKMYPESEQWGTPTCRASVNLIEAHLIDEITGDTFSMNLDLAYAYALFAGNSQGVIKPGFSPDSKKNRTLRTMHTPNIEFEEDLVAGENFNNGGITLRVLDTEQLFRPALVTVYNNADSVLKDQVTTFLCVCIEKIAQDEWNNLCGDTSLSAENYVALFKDNAERKVRDRMGGLVRRITFEPSYNEGSPGGRAVLNTIAHAYFNKGKYMMNLDLFAYNEQDDGNGTGSSSSTGSVGGGSVASPN
jgi:hypothetical protein